VTDDKLQRVIAGLNGHSQVRAFEAAKVVWNDTDVRLERPLIRTLKQGPRPFNRAAAAYAMGVVLHRPRVVAALEQVVNDTSENPRVRGYAAEALHLNHRKKSHDVLLKNLTDPSKQVRFWCAYTLGQMAEHRAIPALERLSVSDRRVVTGYHSVAKEAADALEGIKANKTHRGEQGCISCIENDCQGRSC
jgi:HEAT repeat protein